MDAKLFADVVRKSPLSHDHTCTLNLSSHESPQKIEAEITSAFLVVSKALTFHGVPHELVTSESQDGLTIRMAGRQQYSSGAVEADVIPGTIKKEEPHIRDSRALADMFPKTSGFDSAATKLVSSETFAFCWKEGGDVSNQKDPPVHFQFSDMSYDVLLSWIC